MRQGYERETPVTLTDRLGMTLLAAGEMTTQVMVAGAAVGFFAGYLGVKVVATPINLVEAFVRPHQWTSPWRVI